MLISDEMQCKKYLEHFAAYKHIAVTSHPHLNFFFLNSSFSHANADQLTRHDCEHLQLGFNDRYPRVEKNKQNNSYGKGRLAAKYAPASSLHFRSVGRPYYPLFNLKPNT